MVSKEWRMRQILPAVPVKPARARASEIAEKVSFNSLAVAHTLRSRGKKHGVRWAPDPDDKHRCYYYWREEERKQQQ